MKQIIEKYRNVIIQIATPKGSGTGFYLKKEKLIVTNHHVVGTALEVVIESTEMDQIIAPVLYKDPAYDLAFIQVPENAEFPLIELAENSSLKEGDAVVAIGHPFGLKYTATQGIVSKAERLHNDIKYVQIDAAINPGNSGGPLANKDGEVVGVNTFIIQGSNNLGFALPVSYLKESLNDYRKLFGQQAVRCDSCFNLVTKVEADAEEDYCPHCGNKIEYWEKQNYEASGKAKILEEIIAGLGKDVKLSRRGVSQWEIKEGSATVKINYTESSGYIVGDAHLCRLPRANIGAIYAFLLKENYNLEGVSFSINQQDIILSFIIYDKYFTKETAAKVFQNLFQKADYYDDILVDEFGALWKNQEAD